MSIFTKFRRLTGELVGPLMLPDGDAPEGDEFYGYFEGQLSPFDHWVSQDGLLKQYDPEQKARKLSKPAHHSRWSNSEMSWVPMVNLEHLKSASSDEVDKLAGEARLRYITDTPGQAQTYAKKESQAREWVSSGCVGRAPPFIEAEASALGEDPGALAARVIELSDYWANTKGPQIEASRRKWKVAISRAEGADDVHKILEEALKDLERL